MNCFLDTIVKITRRISTLECNDLITEQLLDYDATSRSALAVFSKCYPLKLIVSYKYTQGLEFSFSVFLTWLTDQCLTIDRRTPWDFRISLVGIKLGFIWLGFFLFSYPKFLWSLRQSMYSATFIAGEEELAYLLSDSKITLLYCNSCDFNSYHDI